MRNEPQRRTEKDEHIAHVIRLALVASRESDDVIAALTAEIQRRQQAREQSDLVHLLRLVR